MNSKFIYLHLCEIYVTENVNDNVIVIFARLFFIPEIECLSVRWHCPTIKS